MEQSINAYAKINLFLDITGKQANGYHSLFMVMQSVSLFDTVTLTQTKTGKISVTCSVADIPTGKKNIAFKAAEAFFAATGVKNDGLKIHIDKAIPSAAGLAGGSADAAAVIEGLCRIYTPTLSYRERINIALCIGSDVPFCLCGGTSLVMNVGDIIAPLPTPEPYSIVLAKPSCAVSTAAAYAAYDEASHIYHPDCTAMLESAAEGDLISICANAGNVFEQVIEVVERVEIKSIMRESGAMLCQMSGSGPTIFGIFKDKSSADICAERLKELCNEVFVCEPVPYGIKSKPPAKPEA